MVKQHTECWCPCRCGCGNPDCCTPEPKGEESCPVDPKTGLCASCAEGRHEIEPTGVIDRRLMIEQLKSLLAQQEQALIWDAQSNTHT